MRELRKALSNEFLLWDGIKMLTEELYHKITEELTIWVNYFTFG